MPVISGGKFVVVGGASQIGSHIGQQLLAAGAREVVLLDNLSLGSAEPLQPLLKDPRCTFVRGDVMRLTDLYDPLAQADGVFAVAGIMPKTMAEDPWAGIDVNIRGVQNTLEACRYRGVKKVVLSSATGVYGATLDDPTTEDSPMRWQVMAPQTVLYVASKVIGETLAQMQRQRHGLDYVALRYSAVYGPRQHSRAMLGGHLAESCMRVRRGEPPIVDGDGRQVQDYIYVGDAARANLMAMESAVTGEAINICTGLRHVAGTHRRTRLAGQRIEPPAGVPAVRRGAALVRPEGGLEPREGQAAARLGARGVDRARHRERAALGRRGARTPRIARLR